MIQDYHLVFFSELVSHNQSVECVLVGYFDVDTQQLGIVLKKLTYGDMKFLIKSISIRY